MHRGSVGSDLNLGARPDALLTGLSYSLDLFYEALFLVEYFNHQERKKAPLYRFASVMGYVEKG